MRVLVIGGSRFVGYQLVWRLLAAGHRITVLNRGTRPDPWGARVERLVADRTTADFARALGGRTFDAAVDFAAYTGADAREAAAVLGGGRVGHYVFLSTGQVYLVRQNCPEPAREADYDGPLTPRPADDYNYGEWKYGRDKRAAEDALAEAWAVHRFPASRLRIPMVNGERDHYRRIESYLWRILDGGPVLLPGGGVQVCRHVYSGDVVRAIAGLLGRPATCGQAYNLAQAESPTLAELVATLAELAGAPARILPVSRAQLAGATLTPLHISPFDDPWMSQLDATRAHAELGFRPEPLRSYLDKIVTCFLNHPPAEPPGNYACRAQELALAAGL